MSLKTFASRGTIIPVYIGPPGQNQGGCPRRKMGTPHNPPQVEEEEGAPRTEKEKQEIDKQSQWGKQIRKTTSGQNSDTKTTQGRQ